MKKIVLYSILISCFALLGINHASGKSIKEKIADSYYKNMAYKQAVVFYSELANSKKANAEILRKTADSYNKIGYTADAVKWYGELYEKGWANSEDKYEYLLALRKAGKYEKANEVLTSYLGGGGEVTEFVKYIQENPDYMNSLQKKKAYRVDTVSFNSPEHDFCPVYFKEGIVYVTPEKRDSRIPLQRKFAWDNSNFLQLYYVKELEDGNYSDPKLIEASSKSKYHDGPICFNSDFSEAYLTRSNYSHKGKLGKSQKGIVTINLYHMKRQDDGSWSNLTPFEYNSDEYSIGSATLSKEGDIMVFASDMPGTKGQTDLWITKKDTNGKWGTPINLGDKINTARRDNYPWLDKDGNLYFSTDGGLQGLGGYDVMWVPGFLSGKDVIYNVGAPINSNADDFGYIYDSDNATGYFNSGRKGVVGKKGYDDIFKFTRLVSLVDVQIIDKKTQLPILGAKGCIRDSRENLIEGNIETNENAQFSRELSPEKYIICGSAEGYDDEQTEVTIPKGKYVTTWLTLSKEKPEETKIPCPEITLEDIYYDFDRYEIRDDASPSLDELVAFMKEYPAAKVNLVSHTDSRGTMKYNDWLSQKRAESAVDYIVAKGVDAARLTARGAGERELVNNCSDSVPCSSVEHQANRRTTIEIVLGDCITISKKADKYTVE